MKCYIFDIDGTLADCSHRLHHIQTEPKNWDAFFAACDGDAPIRHILQLALDLYHAGASIVYVSGRSDQSRTETLDWLFKHGAPAGTLYMRRQGDHTDDHILKPQLLEQVRRDGWEPIMAFDDRKRVVDAWRAAGVPCAQVAPGDF